MHETGDDTEELDGRAGDEPTEWFSGSAGWPVGGEHTIGGGHGSSPRGDDGRRSHAPVPPLLAQFYIPDPPPASWDDVRSLPHLADAPLPAEELRAERLRPAVHISDGDDSDARFAASSRSRLGVACQPSLRRRRSRRGGALAVRFAVTAASVALLVAAIVLLIWTLLAPAPSAGDEPVDLVAAGGVEEAA